MHVYPATVHSLLVFYVPSPPITACMHSYPWQCDLSLFPSKYGADSLTARIGAGLGLILTNRR